MTVGPTSKPLERTLSLWQQAVPAVSPGMTPQSFLRSYVRAKLEFSRTNPTLSRIFASESLSGATLLRTHNKEKMGRTMSTISVHPTRWRKPSGAPSRSRRARTETGASRRSYAAPG